MGFDDSSGPSIDESEGFADHPIAAMQQRLMRARPPGSPDRGAAEASIRKA